MRCSSRVRLSTICWLTMGWMAYMSFGSFVVSFGVVGLVVSTDDVGGWFSAGLATGPASVLGVTGVAELPTDRLVAIGDDLAHDSRVVLVHGVSFLDVDGVGNDRAGAVVWWCVVETEAIRRRAGRASGAAAGAERTTQSHAAVGAAGHGRGLRVEVDHRGTSFGAHRVVEVEDA
jgi:hypothetical protein